MTTLTHNGLPEDYGVKTYDDFNRWCKEFMQLLPQANTEEEVHGLLKALGLAYLSFTEGCPAERLMAAQRYTYLARMGMEREFQVMRFDDLIEDSNDHVE